MRNKLEIRSYRVIHGKPDYAHMVDRIEKLARDGKLSFVYFGGKSRSEGPWIVHSSSGASIKISRHLFSITTHGTLEALDEDENLLKVLMGCELKLEEMDHYLSST